MNGLLSRLKYINSAEVPGMLIRTDRARDIFRRLFLEAHGIEEPVLELNRIVHWKAQMDMIGGGQSILGKKKALFFGGYIYNFSTPPIGAKEIAQAIDNGEKYGADLLVVPTVRDVDECNELEKAHFVRVPCFVESVMEIDGGIYDDIRKRIGGKRYRVMMRKHRVISDEYEIVLYREKDLRGNDELIRLAAELHNENIKKYSYPTNFYNEDVINLLLDTSLSDNLIVGVRYRQSDLYPVQVMIWLYSSECSEVYSLVQGIRHKEVPIKHNLFVAGICDLFRFVESNNVDKIYFGRGNHLDKYYLGANKFYLLNHWLYSEDKDLLAEADAISRRTRDWMELERLPFEILKRGC